MTKQVKLIGWYVIVALLAWSMWGAGKSLGFNAISGLDLNISVTSAFLLLTTIIVIGFSAFRHRWLPLVASAIVGLSFLAWYGFSEVNILGVAIFILLTYETYRRVSNELAERIKINITQILNRGLYPLVIGIFILASFALYQSNYAQKLQETNKLPSQTQAFFQEIASKISNQETSNPQERQYIEAQVGQEAYNRINAYLSPYFKYAPPLLAFGLFLILWGLSWIFVWLGILVGMFFFWVFKVTNVIKIEEKDVKAETLVV